MKQLIQIPKSEIKEKYNKILIVHFPTKENIQQFSKLVKNKLIKNTDIIFEKKTNIINFHIKKLEDKKINSLINIEDSKIWKKYWKEMPKFRQENNPAYKSILIYFKTKDSVELFSKLTNNKITDKTKYIYFPKKEKNKSLKCICTKIYNPKYPIYIISKGRWESRLTVKTLDYMKVPYHIVIEPQEYEQYANVINKKKIKVLPFSNLGQGSIPVRNWVWEDSIKRGFKKHWILDDNIRWFYRLHNNKKYIVTNGNTFYALEQFVDRFKNVGLAGMHYQYFLAQNESYPPFYLNTRIYSCILIDNSLPFRWRGKYNEDTDLSLRVLKSGLCTILFNAFPSGKITTMVMKGGNTEEVYEDTNNRMEFAESLVEQHPDVARIMRRFGRWHHYVDYSPFKLNKLIYKKGIKLQNKNNEYGMKLK